MTLSIDPALFVRFPGLRIGAFLAARLDRTPAMTVFDAIAARHVTPIIGCDVDALPASTVTVRTARPASDWFVPLGARPTDIALDSAVVVYAAGDTVLCWSFDHRASRLTCLQPSTRRAVFFSESVAARQAAEAATALEDLRRALARRGAQIGPAAFADVDMPNVAVRFNDAERRH